MIIKNKPYVKEFDAQGVLLNPIVGSYESKGPNRRDRRGKEPRFIGNGKNHRLTVNSDLKPPLAYIRSVQLIPLKGLDLGIKGYKKIQHYIPKN